MRKFIDAGLSADWLLTGDGPMLFADRLGGSGHQAHESEAPEPSSPVDYELLRSLIESLESELYEKNMMLPPANKAATIQLMYEYCMLEDEPSASSTVTKFLKLLA